MLRVGVPLASGGLGAAAGVSFARGMGEFGATILFAGSFQGVTQTLPLAVYDLFDANLDQAVAIGVLLLFVSAAILLASKLILRSWTNWTSTSSSRGEVRSPRAAERRRRDRRAGRGVGLRKDLAAAHRRGSRPPRQGRIALGGDVWFDAAARIDRKPEQRRVGYVPQDYGLFPHLTVAGNVRFAGRRDRPDLLERLGIAHLAGVRPAQLSGGERQRAALARALAREPRVLLLDEPFGALDTRTRQRVRDELADMLSALCLPTLLVTHAFDDACAIAARIGVLDEGRLVQLDAPSEVLGGRRRRPSPPSPARTSWRAWLCARHRGSRSTWTAAAGSRARCRPTGRYASPSTHGKSRSLRLTPRR